MSIPDRSKLLDKIRGLLSKTVENGCTEAEAMAALAKARAMMDAYEVTEDDLRLTKAEAATIFRNNAERDPHDIRSFLAMSIAEFSDCKAWRDSGAVIVFCGLPSDAAFASWLLETLGAFVQSELARYLMACPSERGARRTIINGFVLGATGRIAERLRQLIEQSKAAATSNGRALVIVKSDLVASKMAELGLNLRKSRRRGRRITGDSYAAGKTAGDRASFGRPVSGAGSFTAIR